MPVNLTALTELASRRGADLFEQVFARMTAAEAMRVLAGYGHCAQTYEYPTNLTAEALLSYLNYHDGKGSFKDTSGWETMAPRLLSGLTSYVDAKDPANIFTTDTGSTNVTATGDAVGKILDLSNNGFHPVQATPANRPTWHADGYLQIPGGIPSAVGLAYPGAMSSYFSNANNTVFAVVRWLGTSGLTAFGNNNGYMGITTGAGPVVTGRFWNGTANQSIVDGPSIAWNTDYIVCMRRSDKVYVSANGGTEVGGTAVSANLSGQSFGMGLPANTSANVANCRIYAVATYNRELAVYERNFLGRWFAYRFGLTWTNQS